MGVRSRSSTWKSVLAAFSLWAAFWRLSAGMASLLPARPGRLTALVRVMDELFPLRRAAAWDNVGLLLDTSKAEFSKKMVVFLTNDLTEKVAAEAIKEEADVVVTYHPTPFHKFKRLSREDVTSRILLALASRGIAVYAPHTACDAAFGGVNDWLLSAFSVDKVSACRPSDSVEDRGLAEPFGAGRVAKLKEPISLQRAAELVKGHLCLEHLRVAPSTAQGPAGTARWDAAGATAMMRDISVKSVAVCAGAGSSVLADVEADLYLTGEMSHHEVLAANHAGVSVILAEHSNTERGFLPTVKTRIEEGMMKQGVPADTMEVKITKLDSDPLLVV